MPESPHTSPGGEASETQPSSKCTGSQIRLVPYSPPRISSESSTVSRPVSYAEASPSEPLPDKRIPPHDGSFGANLHPGYEDDLQETPIAHGTANWIIATESPSPSPRPPSSNRPKRVISVHSDKTFSLLPQADSPGSKDGSKSGSLSSRERSSAAASTLVDRSLSLTSATSTCVDEQRAALSVPAKAEVYSLGPSPSNLSLDTALTPPPRNERFVGGLRRVAGDSGNAPDTQPSPGFQPVRVARPSQGSSTDTRNVAPRPQDTAYLLTQRQSRTSLTSQSTLSEKSNYKTYAYRRRGALSRGTETPAPGDQDSPPSSSDRSNVEVLGESSPEPSLIDSIRPQTGRSEPNYEVYRGESPSSSQLGSGGDPELTREYSRESLVVPPLRPRGYVSGAPRWLGASRQQPGRTVSGEGVENEMLDSEPSPLPSASLKSRMPPTDPSSGGNIYSGIARRWSTALSTLMSEGDLESDHRATSPWQPGSQLESSGFASISDSDKSSPVDAHEVDVQRPLQTYAGGYNRDVIDPDVPLISHPDEHGDGLGDLQSLYRGAPRTRLYSMLVNVPSDRNLRSAGSSRSNSFSRSPIPAWARLYYGSGERRLLIPQKSSDSMFSAYAGQSNRGPLLSVSVQRERVHPRAQAPDTPHARPATRRNEQSQDLTVERIPAHPPVAMLRQLKKQTSSILSPHLHRDKRIHKYSLWQPPHAMRGGSPLSSRDATVQVVLFVTGFVLPFAWMIASFLPQHDANTPDISVLQSGGVEELNIEKGQGSHQREPITANHFNHARWWRSLNRGMAILGLAIIGAAVALIVLGTRRQ